MNAEPPDFAAEPPGMTLRSTAVVPDVQAGRRRGLPAVLVPSRPTVVAYVDPGNFAATIQAGAACGYTPLSSAEATEMRAPLACRSRSHVRPGARAAGIALLAWASAATLCVPTLCRAQLGPTPQPPAANAAPNQAGQPPQEDWAVHGQATTTWLLQPGFASSYQGPQSLSAAANGRETFDTTAYLGVRPWQGAELWFDPEIDQGFGLSDTFGAAGYVSGEAYKVGAQDPYFLMQRLFLRQTIDLGGDTEKLDPDLNQLGGTQTANRLVITAGKFSVVDIFDNNSYAHDPRNDFLNWSVIDQGSFDYAANAWGYTYGAAAEWYQDWWTIRSGLFNLSTVPNGKNVDPDVLAQFQSVTEFEERHSIWGQPGKVRLLYWFDRGELGLYDDAIAFGEETHTVPATGNVRHYRTKDGIELNIEQQIADNIGMFLRAGASQGSVEEDDFTEINQSLSAGLSLGGARWGRSDDTFGSAFAVNEISRAGKQYLAAGGLGGIIGDGQLPNAGPEQIFESYYSAAILKYAHFTFDYQLINHPAYNRDRGPVSVFGLKLHAQF
jgi:high affinity Mn2+ porin